MRKTLILLLSVILITAMLPSCKGMVKASEIKPAVDIVTAEYISMIPDSDPLRTKKISLATELKETVDLAAAEE